MTEMKDVAALISELTTAEGYTRTVLDDVTLFRAEKPVPAMPLVYEQCLCIAVQGDKVTHTDNGVVDYDPSRYLVVPTIVPFHCEALNPERQPLFGLTIDIDYAVIQDILETMGEQYRQATENMAPSPGMYTQDADPEMIESLHRLVKSLRNENDAAVLGRQMIREIYYRALMGDKGHILAAAAQGESAYAKVAKSIRTIHDNFADPLDVNGLAETANMSVRSFHDHFKAATACTPFQYLKRIRLDKARQLLVRKGLQANVTAHMVGYESTSQFSREFKKHFGYPPRDAVENFPANMAQ